MAKGKGKGNDTAGRKAVVESSKAKTKVVMHVNGRGKRTWERKAI